MEQGMKLSEEVLEERLRKFVKSGWSVVWLLHRKVNKRCNFYEAITRKI